MVQVSVTQAFCPGTLVKLSRITKLIVGLVISRDESAEDIRILWADNLVFERIPIFNIEEILL